MRPPSRPIPPPTPPVVGQPAGADDGAQLGGLKSGGTIGTAESVENAGADNINGVTLTGGMDDPNNAGTPLGRSFDPNVAVSTLRAMADDSDPPNPSNDIGDMQAGALGLMGWSHKVLHADWGDTAGGLDAGIETAALIYSNMEAKSVAFNTLSTVLVNADLRAWFALTMNFGTGQAMDADDATDDPNNAVDIADAAADGAATQVANALISPSGQTFAGLVAHPDANDVVLGHYFRRERPVQVPRRRVPDQPGHGRRDAVPTVRRPMAVRARRRRGDGHDSGPGLGRLRRVADGAGQHGRRRARHRRVLRRHGDLRRPDHRG